MYKYIFKRQYTMANLCILVQVCFKVQKAIYLIYCINRKKWDNHRIIKINKGRKIHKIQNLP